MELLYYIDMTKEYYADVKIGHPTINNDIHKHFLFRLGKVVGELGISPVNLEIFDQSIKQDGPKIFLSFKNPEDAMAFKLKWT